MEQNNNSSVVDIAFKVSEKSGEFWGSIFANVVNFSADYVNIGYNCAKISYNSFKKEAEPAYTNAINKFQENSTDETVTDETVTHDNITNNE
tara:strand:+ start:149 stop:424 length:276 start_codon:yes stop_codon:yes gene_type:complete